MRVFTRLERFVRARLQEGSPLIMSHAVLGYPSFEQNEEQIDRFCESGVDLIELQIPFTEAVADGPILLQANQHSVDRGTTVDQCMAFATKICERRPETAFLFMTYLNPILQRGLDQFVKETAEAGVLGIICPDFPPEMANAYRDRCDTANVATVFLVAPTSPAARIKEITDASTGMIYCVARGGVTGRHTDFNRTFQEYIQQVRAATNLPIAVGFGVRNRTDLDALKGYADVAAVCTEAVRLVDEEGLDAAARLLRSLAPDVRTNRRLG